MTSVQQTIFPGDVRAEWESAKAEIDGNRTIDRIWTRDATVWKDDAAHQKLIGNSLGWLDVAETMLPRVGEIEDFVRSIAGEFSDVVVLGMGGSSLCAEVFRRTFGEVAGHPRLSVLDSTVPAAVLRIERSVDLDRTLFVVASKSGTTTEPVMFHRYFYDVVKRRKGDAAGRQFIAVTDPGTQLGQDAQRDGFRHIFTNFADIGGRYSVLSFFGMVPAAVAGIDVRTVLERAVEAVRAARATDGNAAADLGALIGAAALQGRDKVTLLASPAVESLGLWIEQLVAESTGKEDKGVVPVALEPRLPAQAYGRDRLFVQIALANDADDPLVAELREAGHPVVRRILRDREDLGREFYDWEFATAVAGAVMRINPFDQPNVQESKDNTKRILGEYAANGAIAGSRVIAESDGLRVESEWLQGDFRSAADAIIAQLATISDGDYVAFTQYIDETSDSERLLGEMRRHIAGSRGVATTSGYGPRFLHSTGQLHKGGAGNGVFIQINGEDQEPVQIAQENLTFSVLKEAQSLGDFESLASRDRRAIRVRITGDVITGLRKLKDIVLAS